MEISIKNDKAIEELADEIIGLTEVTTNATEVKTQIINLINDSLYQQITNVSLSTILKQEIEKHDNPSVGEQEAAERKAEEKKANKKSTEAKTSSEKTEPTSVAPELDPLTTEDPSEVFAQQSTQQESTNIPRPLSPLEQFEANNEAPKGVIKYNGLKYDYIITPDKRVKTAEPQNVIVVQYHVPEKVNNYIATHEEVQQKIQQTIQELNMQYQGQTPSYYNMNHSLAFVMAKKPSLNDYVNDLDMLVHLILQQNV